MGTKNTVSLIVSLMTLLVFMLGCQNANDKKTEGTKTPEPKAARKEIPLQQPEKRKKKEPIVYFADLMKKRQFVLQDTFEKHLQNKPGALRYNITHHTKKKSIFHRPAGGDLQNTISFNNIPIYENTALEFDIGVFTEGRENFASDGVAFKIVLWDDEMQQVIFEETVKQFDVWKTYVVDLSAYAGKNVTIDWLTEPLEHTLYDSAVWGSPGIIHYSLEKEYEAVDVSSAERHESIVNSIHGMQFAYEEDRVDRGWIADAATTNVLLSNVALNTAIRTEIYIVKYAGEKDESLKIDVLDKNDKILVSSTHRITHDAQEIVDEYQVNHETDLPHKIRIHLDNEKPSIVFIKVPVQFALRNADSKKSKHNVILMSLDTLRADRLGCYGYSRDVSPNIDALAAESIIFTNAYSNSNWTLPAHTSMFTSLYPSQHQITLNDVKSFDFYSSEWPYYYITEAFKKAQYLTVAFTGGGFVNSRYGFNKGFDYHIENIRELNRNSIDILLHFFETHRDIPTFTFFHTYEIHNYFKEKPDFQKYVQNNFQRTSDIRLIDLLIFLKGNPFDNHRFTEIAKKLLPDDEAQYIRDLYDGAIAYTDHLLGFFFDELKNMGVYDNSWIILTSDHGEGLGEVHKHNQLMSWQHGGRLYDNQIKIPFIIKPPKDVMQELSSARSFEQFIQTIDIPPTLLSIIGVKPHQQFNGKNLLPLFTDSNPTVGDVVFSENINSKLFSVIQDGYKLIMAPRSKRLRDEYTYQLYNLRKDPFEKKNVINGERFPKYIPTKNELHQLLEEHVKDMLSQTCTDTTSSPNGQQQSGGDIEVDENLMQRLKDLGYL